MTDKIRVRYAPSPTGDPHVGNVRTALFNYLFAKGQKGQFIVRVEDTDKAREVVGSEDKIKEGLAWLGLAADESPWDGGEHGPYRQSERLETYKKHSFQLMEQGYGYFCFCTSQRLAELRVAQEKNHQAPRYDRHCRAINAAEAHKRSQTEAHVIRLKVPDHEQISWTDLVKGEVAFASDEIDDQVLLKSDGFPTYHLASVVDDHMMQISHVFRGEDWLSSTPKHLLLYKAFGWEAPEFGHFPLILGPDKAKLSKRNGNTSLLYYKNELGVHPMAMVHFMVFLGWTPKTVKETYTLDQLVHDFSLDRVGVSPAVFDLQMLLFLSHRYLVNQDLPTTVTQFNQWLVENGQDVGKEQKDQFYQGMIDVLRLRCNTYAEVAQGIEAFVRSEQFAHLTGADLLLDGKIDRAKALEGLGIIRAGIEQLDISSLPPSADDQIQFLQQYFRGMQPKELDGQAYLHPSRVALTGLRQSMNMFEYLAAYVLKKDGKTLMLERIDRARALLEKDHKNHNP